jgi:hypothetical protein
MTTSGTKKVWIVWNKFRSLRTQNVVLRETQNVLCKTMLKHMLNKSRLEQTYRLSRTKQYR